MQQMDLTGRTLGPYEVIEKLGHGGMATVYKAYQPSMDRHVAIKILPMLLAQDPNFTERFRREARTIAKLEHARILPVYDFGEENGIIFIVMRYLDGGTLSERIRDGAMPPSEAAQIIRQVSEGLDYAHSRGVIHRDIKPANIMLDSSGDAYITDFGIAKLVEGHTNLTGSGIIGTPAYVSPEQGLGQPLDQRSDVYALGVVLYEMLTGRTPYEAETPMAIIIKHINNPLPPPTTINPDLSPEVEAVVLRALAKQPDQRFETCGELATALNDALAGVMPEAVDGGEVLEPSTIPMPPPPLPDEAAEYESEAETFPMEPADLPTTQPGVPTEELELREAVDEPDDAFESIEAPEAKPKKKRRWLLIAGAAVIGICLCLGALAIINGAGDGNLDDEMDIGDGFDEGDEIPPVPSDREQSADKFEELFHCPAGLTPAQRILFGPEMGAELPPGAEIISLPEEEDVYVLSLYGEPDQPVRVRLPFERQFGNAAVVTGLAVPFDFAAFELGIRTSPNNMGYSAIFTGDEFWESHLLRAGQPMTDLFEIPVALDEPYVITLLTLENQIEVMFDGEMIHQATDPQPLAPGGVAIQVMEGEVWFAGFMVCEEGGEGEGPAGGEGPALEYAFEGPQPEPELWHWLHEPQEWEMGNGQLMIPAVPGTTLTNGEMPLLGLRPDVFDEGANAVEVEVIFQPHAEGQGAGLIVLNQDRKPIFSLMRAACGGFGVCEGDGIYFDRLGPLAENADDYTGYIGGLGELPPEGPVFLRLMRTENMLVGFYRLPEMGEWIPVGEWPLLVDRRVGGIGLGTVGGDSEPVMAFFDNFIVWR